MENIYNLEMLIWTEVDFDKMSWHDNPIHALSFQDDFKLLLDIDYIFEWTRKKNSRYFEFWIAPCTLIFENVYNMVFDLEVSSRLPIIDNVTMENPQKPTNGEYINRDLEYDWVIETTTGEINFKSVGYKQYVKQSPRLIRSQKLDIADRGGINFNLDHPQSLGSC